MRNALALLPLQLKSGIYFTQIFPLNIIPSGTKHHNGYILTMTVVAIKARIPTSRSFMHYFNRKMILNLVSHFE